MRRPFIVGERIYLRGLEESDLSGNYFQWFNDEEVCRENSHHRFPNSQARMKAYLEEVSSSRDALVLAIVVKQDDSHIGNITLQAIDHINRSAELAIILGEKDYWGKGYAGEASRLIIKHGFDQLNLNRIYFGTAEKNEGGRKLMKAIGMVEEGRSRQAFYKNGQTEDMIHFSLLRNEFAL